MKTLLLPFLAGLLFTSCSVTLPPSVYKKELHEKVYIENKGNLYTLHTGSAVSGVETEQAIDIKRESDSVFKVRSKINRPVFIVNDTTVIANRHLGFKGMSNFREIGGLRTQEGKTVKWGMVFRSDNLSGLKTKEFDKFKALHIATVFDLRIPAEVAAKQDHLPEGVQYIAQPLVNDKGDLLAGMKDKVLKGEISEDASRQLMIDFYKSAITENIPAVRLLIQQIVAAPNPVLYHCSAGKDRTGIVTAMLLSILKVDRETVIDEYMLSNFYRKDKVAGMLKKVKAAKIIKPHLNAKVIENFMTVDREYINAVFETIDEQYGGMESFIKNQLQIDARMRAAFITKLTY